MGSMRRGERAEGEEEHDGGDGHTDDLGDHARCVASVSADGGAAELDLEAVRPAALAVSTTRLCVRLGEVVGLLVEGDGGVGGVPVRADLAGALAV